MLLCTAHDRFVNAVQSHPKGLAHHGVERRI